MPRKTDALERLEGWIRRGKAPRSLNSLSPPWKYRRFWRAELYSDTEHFGEGKTPAAALHAALDQAEAPKTAARKEAKR